MGAPTGTADETTQATTKGSAVHENQLQNHICQSQSAELAIFC